jgi:hypothetical protein
VNEEKDPGPVTEDPNGCRVCIFVVRPVSISRIADVTERIPERLNPKGNWN